MITCILIECFMPYFALIIMYYHVKIACYQGVPTPSIKISNLISTQNLLSLCLSFDYMLSYVVNVFGT